MSEVQRIDKWLWHARLVRTRTLATEIVSAGRVRLNRERVSRPSHAVRPGDVVTVALPSRVVVLRIEGIAERRGPASLARTLYTDLTPPDPPDPVAAATVRAPAERPAGAGRPTKRDRRATDDWKEKLRTPDDGEI